MSEGYTGDGGGRSFQRVASELRARLADGRYPLHTLLPPQRELAEEFAVSRDTVQRVLTELKSEGWLESRQGSGSRVIRTQQIHSLTSGRVVTLGPLISEAFEQPEVTLDVFTLTSESLDAHIRLQTDRIAAGEIAPQSITLRMLLPDESLDFPYWRTKDGVDDDILRERFLAITRRHTASLRSVLSDLRTMELVPSVDFEIRKARLVPAFKLYLVNKVAALHALYQTNERKIVLEDGREIEAIDVFGLGAQLTHHVKDEDPYSSGTVFVKTHQNWFDSAWTYLT
ncbi:GntR family transcriptional regulator [Streptomyces qaidamensis]|uniref:GntR family transcriptional regulator n=1 Tax=Streptomyces qaidamensis TaxID=1783515 RepID=A0A143C2C5_9ACTN|nr:GntR family transcriptional regulator [Streptomyces qaidamensis]AMW11320.1 GntR family transcriptional regulator [Streptomyces qaidamensis]